MTGRSIRRGRLSATLAFAIFGLAIPADAQVPIDQASPEATPIFLPSSSSYYNQQGFNLPSQTRAHGQDIVRGSGGISCQSAVGGAGPTLDMGVIGTEDPFGRDSASLYGRVTIPLGKKPRRVDCTQLYEMELQRLKLELDVLRQAQAPYPAGLAESERWAQEPIPAYAPGGHEQEGFAPPAFQLGDLAANASTDMTGQDGDPTLVKVASAEPLQSSMPHVATNMARTTDAPAGRRQDANPGPCPDGDIVVLRGDGSRACGPHLEGHTLQIAAYATVHDARAAWEAAEDELTVPTGAIAIIRPRRLAARTLQAVQIARLTEAQARELCNQLKGECIIRHEG